jgi:hypothetical protein
VHAELLIIDILNIAKIIPMINKVLKILHHNSVLCTLFIHIDYASTNCDVY